MYKKLTYLVWLLLISGIGLLVMDPEGKSNWIFQVYLTIVEIYLLGVSAFLVFKHLLFYKVGTEADSIKLSKKSDYQTNMIWHGLILGLIALVLTRTHASLKSFNTILIALVVLYYLIQVVLNSRPAIHISNKSFSYEDYFVERWDWQELDRIELQEDKLRLVDEKKEFELDFELIDEIDDTHLFEEVDRDVLDGEFTRITSSKDVTDRLLAYAGLYSVNIVKDSK